MSGINDYERWKFRRCIETLDRYGCANEKGDCDNCPYCDFNVAEDVWTMLHCELMRIEDSNQYFYNNVSE